MIRTTLHTLAALLVLLGSIAPQSAAAAGVNLVPNGSFEAASGLLPTSWTKGQWGTLTATHVYPVAGKVGNGAEVRVSAYTNGDAKWVFPHVAVNAGKSYTYSDSYRSTTTTSVVAEYKLANGTLSYVWFADVAPSSNWSPFSSTFTVPADAVSMTVYHLLAAKGTLAIDEVSLVENAVVEPPAPGKAMVSITFDDAWKTQYTQALPLLTKYNMKGTFYVTTQYFNTTKYTGFMTRANVKDLYAKGHEIGGHTVSHPHLTKVSSTTLTAELKNSKATLDTLIGKPITGIAYPFGEYNQKVIDEAKKLGYTNGRTVEGGLNVATTDKFRLYSISPSVATPLSEIKQNIDAAKREGKWLIIAFHEIDTNGREYSNTPAYFEEVLRYLQSTGVSVVTVEQGLRAL